MLKVSSLAMLTLMSAVKSQQVIGEVQERLHANVFEKSSEISEVTRKAPRNEDE